MGIDEQVTENNALLSFAVMGCSSIAPSYILGLKKIKGVDVTHIYSRSPERENTYSRKFNLIPCCNPTEIFDNSGIDAVVIATDPRRHFA